MKTRENGKSGGSANADRDIDGAKASRDIDGAKASKGIEAKKAGKGNESTKASERRASVDVALRGIEKAYGKGAIMRLGDGPPAQAAAVISTGSLGLDIALGVGGLPKGRIVEVYGPESSGKTTLALHAIAEAQRAGGVCAFIDAEHAFDVRYAAALGVDTDELLVTQPDYGEQALEIADMLIRSGAVDLIVVDSVAALVPKAELEGEMGDSHVGLHARLMSQAMRKITASTAKHGTMILFINQLRMKIGVMFGSPETTTGGNALKFYASVRLDVRRIGNIKNGDVVTGNRTRVKVVKNKMAAPFRQVEFDLVHGKGIYLAGEVVDLAVEAKRMDKRGAWFALDGESIGQGRDAAARFLEEHPEVMAKLRGELLAAGGIGCVSSSGDEGSQGDEGDGEVESDGRPRMDAAPRNDDTMGLDAGEAATDPRPAKAA